METISNNSNVYILGAGFSRLRGMPLISDFMFALRDAHEWLTSQRRDKEANAIEQVLKFRKESASAAYRVRVDLENIEELFSLASATNDELSDQIKLAIAATLDYCAATRLAPTTKFNFDLQKGNVEILPECWKNSIGSDPEKKSIPFDVASYEFICASLLGRLGAAKSSKNCFITLNYDLVLEEALWSLGIGFDYCFGPKTVAYDNSFRQPTGVTAPLIKLHGSMNWAFPGYQGGKLKVYGSYNEVRQANLAPELVPPTWRKSFMKQSTTVWERGRTEISNATRLVIIGFSMPPTDLHFKYLLAAGLKDNISLREVVFVNPDSDVENRAKQLFGDLSMRPTVRFVSSGIQAFSNGGTIDGCVWSIGRPIDQSIGSIQHLG